MALRIAALPDSSLRTIRLCPVHLLPIATPEYCGQRGMPLHASDLGAYRAMVGAS